MEDNHVPRQKCLSTEHKHTKTGRKNPLNIKKCTFILFIKISIYALFICSLYYSNHDIFSTPPNTQYKQWNKASVKSGALMEQGPAYINKYSKFNEYSKLFHVHDDYPRFNERTYFGRNLAELKSEGDERALTQLHSAISEIKNGDKYFLDQNYRSLEEEIEDYDTGIYFHNIVTKIPGGVIEEHTDEIEYYEAMTENDDPAMDYPDEELIYFDPEIDEHEELDEEEQRLKKYLDSFLDDEVHLKNIHDFIQETEDCVRKYKKKKYDFFNYIVELRKKFNRIIKSIKHRLLKFMTYNKHYLIKVLVSTITRLLSILFL
ncbi:Plasmodium exported protein, unknown function [Plasmodium knowlesi strain H]|uniref:Plasmodium RESA N-terminal domain-containing protein n=3 Tax=Plasmodium knowlesi TaxID=5850 RepID=A0A5K1UYM6_PLAKH|nr:Plasmodium exported protein, unknown function [Plasmodium knowlesi strain H]OTN64031.1 Uncharacterized protein PKNOH_S140218900 [Plasmodium knowlesi]CAA9990617.1 Plasmodium exported protein, unknown function [Plasmodium knowlesi strain H]SBO26048.1 Plasmodium exported protein, unknown function [Plasmodium knowlesi strain H]SBO28741.1 Plasmodium exported protein, unknown function [Plasmodium knowlesi strain H]VVS80091.1 Plasmodium exported protein, unknown function [Plasmodium knowlesi strai|eukprot:XP_002261909.1 hypothetical protein, conserved in Plasmodium species [Plasmodium knowlesi strain H]